MPRARVVGPRIAEADDGFEFDGHE
jgi:hypothetical protein